MRFLNGWMIFTVIVMAFTATACSKKSDQPNKNAPVAPVAGAARQPVRAANPVKSNEPSRYVPLGSVTQQVQPPKPVEKPILTQTNFLCADGTGFTAQFRVDDVNILSGKNPPIVLKQEKISSGFWYRNRQYSLLGKGRQIQFLIQGRKPVTCTAK